VGYWSAAELLNCPRQANSGLEWATRQPNPASSLFILDLGRNVMTTAII